jgi:hypothetical protein
VVDHALEKVVGALGAVYAEHRIDRFEPFLGLFGIRIVRGCRE